MASLSLPGKTIEHFDVHLNKICMFAAWGIVPIWVMFDLCAFKGVSGSSCLF